jgi:hypothetical protein
MSITTSSGERYDSLENFMGNSPSEYIAEGFNALYGYTKLDKPKPPVGPVNAPTPKGDWESEVLTDLPPQGYMVPSDTMKDYKKYIEDKRNDQQILDTFKIPSPGEKGRVIRPGEEDYIRSKDLGKPVVYAQNDNIPPNLGTTVPNIAGGLSKPPKPANDNDKRKKF